MTLIVTTDSQDAPRRLLHRIAISSCVVLKQCPVETLYSSSSKVCTAAASSLFCASLQRALIGNVIKQGSQVFAEHQLDQVRKVDSTQRVYVVQCIQPLYPDRNYTSPKADNSWFRVTKSTQVIIDDGPISLTNQVRVHPQSPEEEEGKGEEAARTETDNAIFRIALAINKTNAGERLSLAINHGLRLACNDAHALLAHQSSVQERNILVHASPLSGFSQLLNTTITKLGESHKVLLHTIWAADLLIANEVDCQNILHSLLRKAIASQPCVVIFQDLDVLLLERSHGVANANMHSSSVVSCIVADFLTSVNSLPSFRQIFVIGRLRLDTVNEHEVFQLFQDNLVLDKPSVLIRRNAVEEIARLYSISRDECAVMHFESIVNQTSGQPLIEVLRYAYTIITEKHREGSFREVSSSRKVKTKNRPIGMESVINSLTEYILWPRMYKSIYSHFLGGHGSSSSVSSSSFTGVLLYGPPGTGKTMLVKYLDSILGCRLLTMHISELIRGEIGAGEKALRKLFQLAKQVSPCIIFFDEFQSVFTNRTDGDVRGSADIGHTLSSTLAGCFDDIAIWNRFAGLDNLVTVIAATNEPWAIDKGFLRAGRFERYIFVGVLDKRSRMSFLSDKINVCKWTVNDMNWVIDHTKNYTGADMKRLLRRTLSIYSRVGQSNKHLSLLDHFRMAISSNASVQQEDIQDYLMWKLSI